MTARDKIHVSSQNRQEQASHDALRPYLRPWRITFLDQRDDFGRDGLVQVVDEDREGNAFISPLAFLLQTKSAHGSFAEVHSESVETRHLANWSDASAIPLVLAIWSVADRQFRFRTARTVVDELKRTNPDWKTQQYVSVKYAVHQGYDSPEAARAAIARLVRHEMDQRGGVETFHSAKRRVVLTTLARGTVTTSNTLTLDDSTTLVVGEGWLQNDLDAYEVAPERLIVAALLLYEEVWLPFTSISICMDVLGDDVTLDLIERGRMRLYGLHEMLGFIARAGAVTGEIIAFHLTEENPIGARLGIILSPKRKHLLNRLTNFVEIPLGVAAARVQQQTLADLQMPAVRNLLGLRTHVGEKEPLWDAQLVNRLVSVNLAQAIGAALRADAIQYEAGLSRIASEKDYRAFGLDRRFDSTAAFDAALRATGTPDLGQLLQRIPLPKLVELSASFEAQEFRDWFWDGAASILGAGAEITREFTARIGGMIHDDLRAFRLPVRLKFRFLESFGSEYVVGRSLHRSAAFSSTSADGESAISRQRKNWARFRLEYLVQRGLPTDAYVPCPCGSPDRFRFCCGRPPSKL